MSTCSSCEQKFAAKPSGGFRRYTLRSLASPYTAKKVFGAVNFANAYICDGCAKILRIKTSGIKGKPQKRRWSGPRIPPKSSQASPGTACETSPLPKKPDVRETPKKESEQSMQSVFVNSTTSFFKSSAMKYIAESHYEEAYETLISNSECAKNALLQVSVKLAQSEMKKAATSVKENLQIKDLMGDVTMDRLENFEWESVIEDAKAKIPHAFDMLSAMLPEADHIRKGVTKGRPGAKR